MLVSYTDDKNRTCYLNTAYIITIEASDEPTSGEFKVWLKDKWCIGVSAEVVEEIKTKLGDKS